MKLDPSPYLQILEQRPHDDFHLGILHLHHRLNGEFLGTAPLRRTAVPKHSLLRCHVDIRVELQKRYGTTVIFINVDKQQVDLLNERFVNRCYGTTVAVFTAERRLDGVREMPPRFLSILYLLLQALELRYKPSKLLVENEGCVSICEQDTSSDAC